MLKAAFYETDITPRLYDCMPGQFEARYAPTIMDPLYAHALAIENGDEKVIVISLDCIVIEKRDVLKIRRRIFDATGVKNVMVHAIHNHTGGPVAHLYASERDDRYCEELVAHAADAAIMAWQKRVPAKFGWATKEVFGLSFNRRFLFKDGHVDMNPGINNPNVVRAVDIIDPTLTVVRVDHEDGTPMGVIMNFPLHLDSAYVTPQGFSADYPGIVRQDLLKEFGSHFGFMNLTGCCGNINHIDTTGKVKNIYTDIGHALAEHITGMYGSIETAADLPVRFTAQEIVATIERPTWEMVEKAPNAPRRREVEEAYHLPGGTVACEVQSIGIGELALVALPGEVFTRFGLDIKARSPFGCTLVAELCNAANGYIKTRAAADEGGYEATPSTYNILDRNAGYLMADAAVDNLNKIH